MGHLSRCQSLVAEFNSEFNINWIIKTDAIERVQRFINDSYFAQSINRYNFFDVEVNKDVELEFLINYAKQQQAFLIIDHYSATEDYQHKLKQAGVRWLQFDSHGKFNFYADLVLHGSPGATSDIYETLRRNPKTEFLLGIKYAIVNRNFRKAREFAQVRKKLRKVLFCFGGGNDKGATFKFLNFIEKKWFEMFHFDIIVTDANPKLKEICEFAKKYKTVNILKNRKDIHQLMVDTDLAIIPPGTLSYESASVGLPMLLITLADNQNINARGWEKIGAGISLGAIDDLSKNKLNQNLSKFLQSPEKLSSMSEACFNAIDGLGTVRAKNKIIELL